MAPAQSDPQQRKRTPIGLAKGVAKGQAIGLAKGVAKGLAKGLAKGVAQGLAKGLAGVTGGGPRRATSWGHKLGAQAGGTSRGPEAGGTSWGHKRARHFYRTGCRIRSRTWMHHQLTTETAKEFGVLLPIQNLHRLKRIHFT